MGLLGQGWDDPQSSAIMALAGGLLKGDFGGGLLGANDAFAQAKQNALKQKLTDAQLRNYDSEIEARKLKTVQDQRQQRLMESFFPGLLGGDPQGGSAPMGAPAGGASMGAGPVGGPPQGMAPAPAQGGGNDILRLSQQLGIPPQAIQADIVFNGGKKISEMLAERSKPNWQNVNGNLVNTNAPGFQGGFQPGVFASSDGRVTMTQPDGQGGIVVGAPRGALETYGAYQNVGEGAKARFDPLPITPAGGTNPVMRSRLSVMQEANTPAPQPGMNGAFVGSPEAVAAAIAGIKDPQERANAQAAFERQMRANNGQLGIPMQSEAEKLKLGKLAEADATRQIETTNKGNQFKDFRDQLNIAKTLLQAGPTNSTLGAAVDTMAGAVGYSPPGATIAQALDTTSKWLSQNIPKAPGAQSDAELKEYQGAAGLVGDRRVPVAQRMAALQTVERLINTWEQRRAGGSTQSGGATGDFSEPTGGNVVAQLPKMAPKGTRARDKSTGEILEFNGMSWVKVK